MPGRGGALPVSYFHIVFTLPAEIAAIAFHNKAAIYDLLFRAASETMLTIAADPKHLGARICPACGQSSTASNRSALPESRFLNRSRTAQAPEILRRSRH